MDDSVTAVCAARATNFMEVWVQQELQATTAAPDARVMQLDFKPRDPIKFACDSDYGLKKRSAKLKEFPSEVRKTASPLMGISIGTITSDLERVKLSSVASEAVP